MELFDHLTVYKQITELISDTKQYLESLNFVDMLNRIIRNRTVWSFI